jgi:hypothetical protein
MFFHAILLAIPTSTSRHSFWALSHPDFLVAIVLYSPYRSLSFSTTPPSSSSFRSSRSMSHESHLLISGADSLPTSVFVKNPSMSTIALSSKKVLSSVPHRGLLIVMFWPSGFASWLLALWNSRSMKRPLKFLPSPVSIRQTARDSIQSDRLNLVGDPRFETAHPMRD